MPNRHQAQQAPHPQEAANAEAQKERERNAGKTPAPHPSQVMAQALGTQTHTLDREAVAQYHAGHPKKAEAVQTQASESTAEGTGA